MFNITQKEYRDLDAISNSELLLVERSPSDLIWSRNAPTDNTKQSALDYGTALHAALLEPDTINNLVDVYTDTKTRETKAFQQYATENAGSGKLILLEAEWDKIRLSVDSALAHPTFAKMIAEATHKEVSIVTELEEVKVKIRPDLLIVNNNSCIIGDVKTTASLSDWRESAMWKNPLFTHNYGHTAALYLDALSAHLGYQINEYHFLVVSKAIEMGRYPVAVISVSREELERYGFFNRVYANLARYEECKASDNWVSYERFPLFPVADNEVDISFEGDE